MILPDWRRAHGEPVISGELKASPEDFEVVEELGFEPDGRGEHDFLRVEKRSANTAWVAGRLARFAGVPARDAGFSGLKDRHALVRQWFSVRRPAGGGSDWSAFAADGVRILCVTRNSRKLRRGAHRCNRFRIRLHGLAGAVGEIGARLEILRTRGVPNYFGEQRFGRDGANLADAERLADGARLPRGRRGLALSAARSFLFNAALDARVREGTWDRLTAGDHANLDGSGSFFFVDAPDEALERRVAALDLHPTGALPGRARDAGGESAGAGAAVEQAVAERFPRLARAVEIAGVDASRRPLRIAVRDLSAAVSGATLEIGFSLAPGAFATAVLRELAAYREPLRPSST